MKTIGEKKEINILKNKDRDFPFVTSTTIQLTSRNVKIVNNTKVIVVLIILNTWKYTVELHFKMSPTKIHFPATFSFFFCIFHL